MTIQMKATEQYFPSVLFIMLCKVVLNFQFVDETLKCLNENDSSDCGVVFSNVKM